VTPVTDGVTRVVPMDALLVILALSPKRHEVLEVDATVFED